ncbi:MAG TPA: hypothetical protein VIF11_22685 [Methylomirabilota bacterium]|jgi:hypothetical protein
MKTLAAALATSLTMVSLGAPIAVSAQGSMADTTAKPRKTAATSRRMTAEVLAVNRGATALTVRSMLGGKETDVIFSVPESVAPVLGVLEPGDLVQVTYVRVNDQLQAQRIVRAPEAPQRQ